jgi:hypothetical protein
MYFVCVWETQIYDEVCVTRLQAWSGMIRILCTYLTLSVLETYLVYFVEVSVPYCLVGLCIAIDICIYTLL